MSKMSHTKRANFKGQRKALIVRLPVEVYDPLTEFCALAGVTRNDFVTGVLEESLPTLQELLTALRTAKQGAPAHALRAVSLAVSGALSALQAQGHQTQFDLGVVAGQAKAPRDKLSVAKRARGAAASPKKKAKGVKGGRSGAG